MSLDPSVTNHLRDASPVSSGRNSPSPRVRNDTEDALIKKDPKIKKYAVVVERALALFENTVQEWADYISFLGRLLKALQSSSGATIIPSKLVVAKRLAQCLNPRLPSGVHQKTLEVYSYIFSIIGHDGLAHDHSIWTPGLVPLLSYASISVKPHYLSLFETYYVPLGEQNRPALKSLILSILPGIEEEGGEHFDRTLALIESIRKGINEETYFWQCLLLAIITAPGRRAGALVYLNKQLPVLKDEESLSSPLVSPEPGLLVRAFCAGLSDEQFLVQRGFLELLVQNLPLSSPILQKLVTVDDRDVLLARAATVVLRRDMSLNRRLWAWLSGPEEPDSITSPSGSHTSSYFGDYGQQSLVRGILNIINRDKLEPAERARPYRICLSLMDRRDVGGAAVPELFIPIIRSVKAYKTSAGSKEQYTEALRSASMFFDGVEPKLIWAKVAEVMIEGLEQELNGGDSREYFELISYILKTFNVREEEMVIIYVPLVLLSLAAAIKSKYKDKKIPKQASKLMEELLTLIPDRAFTSALIKDDFDPSTSAEELHSAVSKFFSGNDKSQDGFPPFSTKLCGEALLYILADLTCAVLESSTSGRHPAGIHCRLLEEVMRKVPKVETWSNGDLVETIAMVSTSHDVDFETIEGCTSLLAIMSTRGYCTSTQIDDLVIPLTRRIWSKFTPDTPKFHVEASKALWRLQDTLVDRRIEAALCALMVESNVDEPSKVQAGRNFTTLWSHGAANPGYELMLTRPMFLFLDALADESAETHVLARSWLQNLTTTERLFDALVTKLISFPFLKNPEVVEASVKSRVLNDDDDLDVCLYYMETLSNVLKYCTPGAMTALSQERVPHGDEQRRLSIRNSDYLDDNLTFQTFFAKVSLAAIHVRAMEGSSARLLQQISRLQRTSLSILYQLLLGPNSKALEDLSLEIILIERLKTSLKPSDTFVQVPILDVLFASLKNTLFKQIAEQTRIRDQRPPSREITPGKPSIRVPTIVEPEKEVPVPVHSATTKLVEALIEGFRSPTTRPVLDSWVSFLTECLPLLSPAIFQVLLPLVECFCKEIRNTFASLKLVFSEEGRSLDNPEHTLIALLNGLEHILAAAHDQLAMDEMKLGGPRSPHEPGFFGNMVSGMLSGEGAAGAQTRSPTANNRLTVLLCFQDTIRICFSVWMWNEATSAQQPASSSFSYTASRLRSRARRILEHLFQAETLECLETLMEIWIGKGGKDGDELGFIRTPSIFKLVHVLDGARPKHTVAAIFNSIFSRTNPSVLDPKRKSSLTAELADTDVSVFLADYAKSLDDDAMDEIWSDCLLFLSDVLKNPFPHRQTLPYLLQFTATLGEKVDNTNFGEQKRQRKELGDLFLRLLTAMFTVRPVVITAAETPSDKESTTTTNATKDSQTSTDDILRILLSIVPVLRKVLIDQDRVISAATTISGSVIGPGIRSKFFPAQTPDALLELLLSITRISNSQKAWKKEVADAFGDARFFTSPVRTVEKYWAPLLRGWHTADKERLPELFLKLTPPTTAGVIFGVGATSARNEADKRTGQTLRRIAALVYAGHTDAYVVNLPELEVKLVELLSATSSTSPSSVTRAEVFMLLRALVLRVTPQHLAPFWPIVNGELQACLSSLFPGDNNNNSNTASSTEASGTSSNNGEKYTDAAILEACKLLDTLLVVSPDEFQLHEWLFVTDSIEAVSSSDRYYNPVALADAVSYELGMVGNRRRGSFDDSLSRSVPRGSMKKPLLTEKDSVLLEGGGGVNIAGGGAGGADGSAAGGSTAAAGGVVGRVVRPFLSYLSIWSFENTYAMGVADVKMCEEVLLKDLFDEHAAAA